MEPINFQPSFCTSTNILQSFYSIFRMISLSKKCLSFPRFGTSPYSIITSFFQKIRGAVLPLPMQNDQRVPHWESKPKETTEGWRHELVCQFFQSILAHTMHASQFHIRKNAQSITLIVLNVKSPQMIYSIFYSGPVNLIDCFWLLAHFIITCFIELNLKPFSWQQRTSWLIDFTFSEIKCCDHSVDPSSTYGHPTQCLSWMLLNKMWTLLEYFFWNTGHILNSKYQNLKIFM